MNNDTHTEERRQWLLELQMNNFAEQYHQDLFDKDHAEALQKNETWDCLQGILDDGDLADARYARKAIAKLRRNWFFQAFARE
jgi:hypothetical protein|tara:strand:- start:8032 stop:8280 length:249 start_codon:yes stop_codon:yes gene_type:complete